MSTPFSNKNFEIPQDLQNPKISQNSGYTIMPRATAIEMSRLLSQPPTQKGEKKITPNFPSIPGIPNISSTPSIPIVSRIPMTPSVPLHVENAKPYPQQSYPQQSYPQQSYPQQSYPQQSYPQQSYHQQSYHQQQVYRSSVTSMNQFTHPPINFGS